MNERKPYAVLPTRSLSREEYAYAKRMGILKEPRWESSINRRTNLVPEQTTKANQPTTRLNLGDPDVLPAGEDIRSSFGLNIESRSGTIHRTR